MTSLDAYREQVRTWLAETAATRGWLEPGEPSLDRSREAQAALQEAGYAGITWPTEYGGAGLTNREQVVFNQESAAYALPIGPFIIGLGMCGPTVLAAGSEEQRQRYLAPMLRGEEIWCQLFSEPEAGSDVAGIRTRAERQHDGSWLVRGHKVWTSGAQYSDWGLLLARSDPDSTRHAGLTMFAIDMRARGVKVEPLRQMNQASGFNEVFFDDVVLPADATIGDVGRGWHTALVTLMNERVAIGTGRLIGAGLPTAADLAARARSAGVAPGDARADAIADLYIREQVVGLLGTSINEAVIAGRTPGPQGSIAKLYGTELARHATTVEHRLAGLAGQAWDPGDTTIAEAVSSMLTTPGRAIAGGTDEIMRNIIGERVLGLPREPR
jgi:alkylation response protein AidB-like acyl-CoA dehydrogenase